MRSRTARYPDRMLAVLVLGLVLGVAGCAPAPIRSEPTPIPPQFTATPAQIVPATPTDPPVQPQKLRVTNQSARPIQHLVVRFPEGRVDFGEVLPGMTTGYLVVPNGVYSYAAYDVELDERTYQQPVMDWVGETPMPGEYFTYVLDVDPARWTTEGQVIRLVEVKADPAPSSNLPPAEQPTQVYFPAFDRFQMFAEFSGWAIASETLQILRTTDGGITWQDVPPPALKPAWFPYAKAYFLDAANVWIPNGGKIFRTSDAGRTWQDFPTPFRLATLQFLDKKTGWAFADPFCGAGTCWMRLFRTTDGGQTWSLLNINAPNGPQTVPDTMPSGSIHILSGDSFKFSDPSTLWFGGNGIVSSPTALLMVSRDQGRTWQKQSLPLPQLAPNSSVPATVELPVFLTATDGYFTAKYELPGTGGSNSQLVTAVFATQDGGGTWTPRPTLLRDVIYFDKIDFVSVNDAFVRCGESLCVTHDGARTWQTIQSNKRFTREGDEAFNIFDFVNPLAGWAVVKSRGDNYLYQTTDGGATWSEFRDSLPPFTPKLRGDAGCSQFIAALPVQAGPNLSP